MVVLPFAEFPFFTEEATLDGVTYRFFFLWNSRAERWTMNIYDLSDVPILEGIPLALGQEMIRQYPQQAVPPGQLWVIDATGSLDSIGRDDLAEGLVQLVYVPEDEVAA